MNIVITGGSGFIGAHLIKALLEVGHSVVNFDKNQSQTYPELTLIGDIRNSQSLTKALNGSDLVIHLAAEHKDNVTPKSLYYDVNVQGAQNLVDACEMSGIKRIIFTSTVAVYGLDLFDSNENSDLIPFNDYGKSKLQAEQIFTKWSTSQKDRILSAIRPTVVFGEGNRGNVYNLMKQVAENKFIMIGNGQNRKSIAYVGNLVEYIVSILEESESSVVNYADKPDLTMEQLIASVNRSLNKTGIRLHIPYWLGLTGGYLLDLLSFISQKEFPISAIRIKKFCSNSTINTDRLRAREIKNVASLPSAVESTIKHEFVKNSIN